MSKAHYLIEIDDGERKEMQTEMNHRRTLVQEKRSTVS